MTEVIFKAKLTSRWLERIVEEFWNSFLIEPEHVKKCDGLAGSVFLFIFDLLESKYFRVESGTKRFWSKRSSIFKPWADSLF